MPASPQKMKRAQSAHKTAFDVPSPVRRRVAQDSRGHSDEYVRARGRAADRASL